MLVPRRFLQLIVVTIACLAIATTTTTLCAQELSQEGQNQKAIHDYLFEKFLEGRETKYQGKGDARALKELTILKETREIRDGDELLLPPPSSATWQNRIRQSFQFSQPPIKTTRIWYDLELQTGRQSGSLINRQRQPNDDRT